MTTNKTAIKNGELALMVPKSGGAKKKRKAAPAAKSAKSASGKGKQAKGKKRPVVKYYKIGFAISEKERNELLRFCKQDGIALKALFKKAARLYVKDRLETLRKEEEDAENQLDLFKPIPYQTTLF